MSLPDQEDKSRTSSATSANTTVGPLSTSRATVDTSTVTIPSDFSYQLPTSHIDNSLLIPAITAMEGIAPDPVIRRQPAYRPRPCAHFDDPPTSGPSPRDTRPFTTVELLSRYARGIFTEEEQPNEMDDDSETNATPPENRLPVRIAQSLTIAANFDHTFSLSHLAARDLMLIDAFLRHSFYTSIRQWIVEDSFVPNEADLDYPPVLRYSVLLIVQHFRGVHNATSKLLQFHHRLADNPHWWQSQAILLDLHQQLLPLIYNVLEHRHKLADLLIPHVLNPLAENRELTDLLDEFRVSITRIQHLFAAATGAIVYAISDLQNIASGIHRLYSEQNSRSQALIIRQLSSPTPADTEPAADTSAHRETRRSRTPPSRRRQRSVRTRSRSRSPYTPRSRSRSYDGSPRRSDTRPQSCPTCHFCKGLHYTAECRNITSLRERCIRAATAGRCFQCLYVHPPGACRRDKPCRICRDPLHHHALCPNNQNLEFDIGRSTTAFYHAMKSIYDEYHSARRD